MALCLVYLQQLPKVSTRHRHLSIEDVVLAQTGLDFHGITEDIAPDILEDLIDLFRSAHASQSQDFLGDSLEIVLSFLNSAGRYGQFRTPSHIAHFMARTTPITEGDVLLDPAAGTGGFLVAAVNEKQSVSFDILGDEIDQTMVSVARANVLLAGRVPECIRHRDALETLSEEADVILANPPFSGRIVNRASYKLTSSSNKSELLFIELIMRRLRENGVACFVIPSGVLTNTDKASVATRKRLIDEGQVLCVVELPRGVFRPYTDVLTAIVYWRKSGRTSSVHMFRPMSDGFTLDDRREPCENNQLLEVEADVKRVVKGASKTRLGMKISLASLEQHSFNLLPAWYQETENVVNDTPSLSTLVDQLTAHSNRIALLTQALRERTQHGD